MHVFLRTYGAYASLNGKRKRAKKEGREEATVGARASHLVLSARSRKGRKKQKVKTKKNDSARIGTRNLFLLSTVKPGQNRERVTIMVRRCLLVCVAADRSSALPLVANFTAVTRPLFFRLFVQRSTRGPS